MDSDQVANVAFSVHGAHPAAPAQCVSAGTVGSELELGFSGSVWRSHTLEYSPDLIQWFPLANILPMLPAGLIQVSTGGDPVRFYRLRSH